MKYTITLSDAEDKAMKYIAYDVQDWLDNAIHNRAKQAVDQIVMEHTDKQPNKLSQEVKNQIVEDADIQTAKEKQDAIN